LTEISQAIGYNNNNENNTSKQTTNFETKGQYEEKD
jgi:hypothetical protein